MITNIRLRLGLRHVGFSRVSSSFVLVWNKKGGYWDGNEGEEEEGRKREFGSCYKNNSSPSEVLMDARP